MSEGDFQVRTVQAAQLSSRRSLKLSFSAFRRTTQASALMVAGAGLIVLVAVSPLALKQIAPLGGKEWARLQQYRPNLWRRICAADRTSADRCRRFDRSSGAGSPDQP